MTDTDPTTHTTDLLAQHQPRPGSVYLCRCGWRPVLMLNDTESDRQSFVAHQTELLAAAGLLTTPTPAIDADPEARRWLSTPPTKADPPCTSWGTDEQETGR